MKQYITYLITLLSSVSLIACASSKPTNLLSKLWSVQVGGFGESSVSGDLFLGYTPELEAGGGRITAVSLSRRNVLWRSEASAISDASGIVAVNSSAVYIFLNGKGLLVYTRNGELLATIPPPNGDEARGGAFGAAPALVNETLLIPNGRHLYAYNVNAPASPVLLWKRTFPTSLFALAIDASAVYVGGVSSTAEANVVKLSLDNGQELWASDLQSFGDSAPATLAFSVFGEQLITYSHDITSSVQGFNKISGKRLWATSLHGCSDGAGFASALEVGGGMVFVSPSTGSCIFAFDLTTGKQAWVVATGEVGPDGAITIGGRPLYHNGVLYTSVERLWALDAVTGRVLSFASQPALDTTDTIVHYANGEILVWGDELTAYRPIR